MLHYNFKKRFFVCLFITVPIFVMSPTFQKWFGITFYFYGQELLIFLLSSVIFFYGGMPFLTGFYKEIRSRSIGMMSLISIALIATYFYSSVVLFFMPGTTFFWELATLVDVMLLGHWIEMRTVAGASKALEKLAALLPSEAHMLLPDGSVKDVPVSEIKTGDTVLIKSGEKVSADGTVISGSSEVNEAALTGESKLIFKTEGDQVIAGSINETGSLTVKVEKDQKQNYISQVIDLVKKVMASKSQAQTIADKAAFVLTMIALSVGSITLLTWLLLQASFAFALERMVSVLVITCPHALGLAIPLVVAAVTSIAARYALLIRNRTAFENARKINMVVFDKTGTLTKGSLVVTDVIPIGDISKDELLSIAASLEQYAKHSIAQAIVQKAKEEKSKMVSITELETIAGKGITGQLKDTTYYIGNDVLLKELNLEGAQEIIEIINRVSKEAKTVVFIGTDTQVIGALAASDEIRKDALEAVTLLHKKKIEVAMITGDNLVTAQSVGKQLGITTVLAQVLPHEKSAEIKKLQEKGFFVAMVGDGINDAPALVTADVGIAIGAGTDIALEAADVVLVQNDTRQVVTIINLSQASFVKMIQNLFWATGYNVVALPLAAGVLYTYNIMLNPAVAALLMSVSTIIVAINATTLYFKKIQYD